MLLFAHDLKYCAKCCQFQKPANKRDIISVCCQMSSSSGWLLWPLETTKVSLRKKKNSHSDIVDISVNSQGSELALEMAEDWKMLSEQCCLCRAQAHCLGTGNIQKTVWPSFTPRYFGPRLPENDLKNSNLDSNIQLKQYKKTSRETITAAFIF